MYDFELLTPLGYVNSVSQSSSDKMPAPNASTTTISTVVLQRHSTKIVVALLQSGIHIHLKVGTMKLSQVNFVAISMLQIVFFKRVR